MTKWSGQKITRKENKRKNTEVGVVEEGCKEGMGRKGQRGGKAFPLSNYPNIFYGYELKNNRTIKC